MCGIARKGYLLFWLKIKWYRNRIWKCWGWLLGLPWLCKHSSARNSLNTYDMQASYVYTNHIKFVFYFPYSCILWLFFSNWLISDNWSHCFGSQKTKWRSKWAQIYDTAEEKQPHTKRKNLLVLTSINHWEFCLCMSIVLSMCFILF